MCLLEGIFVLPVVKTINPEVRGQSVHSLWWMDGHHVARSALSLRQHNIIEAPGRIKGILQDFVNEAFYLLL